MPSAPFNPCAHPQLLSFLMKLPKDVEFQGQCIVVLSYGFVMHGYFYLNDKRGYICNPLNIRRYGTERGLGQIGIEGPTSQTALDAQPDLLIFPVHSLVYYQPCNEETASRWPNVVSEHEQMSWLEA